MQAAAGSRPVQALKGVRARLPAWRHKPAELAARAGSAIASRASSVRSALASAEARAWVYGRDGLQRGRFTVAQCVNIRIQKPCLSCAARAAQPHTTCHFPCLSQHPATYGCPLQAGKRLKYNALSMPYTTLQSAQSARRREWAAWEPARGGRWTCRGRAAAREAGCAGCGGWRCRSCCCASCAWWPPAPCGCELYQGFGVRHRVSWLVSALLNDKLALRVCA